MLLQRLTETMRSKNLSFVSVFSSFDFDSSGDLDEKEFGRLVLHIDKDFDRSKIPLLFKRCDVNGDRQVSLSEFASILKHAERTVSNLGLALASDIPSRILRDLKYQTQYLNISLKELINKFDTNKSGLMEFSEFKKMISEIDRTVTEGEAEKVFNLVKDTRQNPPSVNTQKLQEVLEKLPKASDAEVNALLKHLKQQLKRKGQKAKEVFGTLDLDGNGNLNLLEFERFVKMVDSEVDRERILLLFRHFDLDNDKRVAEKEFLAAFGEIVNPEREIENLATQMKLNDRNILSVFKEHDLDRNGSLDPQEFNNLILNIAPSFQQNKIEAIFRYLDQDGDHKVTSLELMGAFSRVSKEQAKKAEAKKQSGGTNTSRVSLRDNGPVGLQQKPDAVSGSSSNQNVQKAETIIERLRAEVKRQKTNITDLFNKFDLDINKELDLGEFGRLVKDIDPNLNHSDIAVLFKAMDLNYDNSIDSTELVTALRDKRSLLKAQNQEATQEFLLLLKYQLAQGQNFEVLKKERLSKEDFKTTFKILKRSFLFFTKQNLFFFWLICS